MLNRPEWQIQIWGDIERPTIVVCSEDFTHDVCLEISGDFWCVDQRIEYANKIAEILNLAGPIVLESDKDKRYELPHQE